MTVPTATHPPIIHKINIHEDIDKPFSHIFRKQTQFRQMKRHEKDKI